MLIIAHRGASGHAVENSLPAMEKALELGADAIELDLQCVEGTLVVFHDKHLDNKTNSSGPLNAQTLSHLSQVELNGGEKIPTLWQVLECVAGRCDFNLELKGRNTVKPLLAILKRAESELGYKAEQFSISAFNHNLLTQVKAARPDLKIGALISKIPQDLAAGAERIQADSLNANVEFINQELVDDAHKRGLKVYVYTVNKIHDLHAMKALGVDGIFSDYPDRSRKILGGHTHKPGECWNIKRKSTRIKTLLLTLISKLNK